MRTKAWTLLWWLVAVLPGLAAAAASTWYVLLDWAALNRSFALWERLVHSGGDMRALMVAQTYQNSLRINCFAEGVGVLLGLLLVAVGLYGLQSLSLSGDGVAAAAGEHL